MYSVSIYLASSIRMILIFLLILSHHSIFISSYHVAPVKHSNLGSLRYEIYSIERFVLGCFGSICEEVGWVYLYVYNLQIVEQGDCEE